MQYLALAVVTLVLVWAWRVARAHSRVKVLAVVDGDTLLVLTRAGRKLRLRLRGIDAPETGQPGADVAKLWLQRLALNRWVGVRWWGTDRYRRRLADVRVGSVDLAAALVMRGLAFPCPGRRLRWLSWGARLTWRGVWRPGQPRPSDSLRRRWPLWGLLLRRRRRTR